MLETVFMCSLTDAFIVIFYQSIAHFPATEQQYFFLVTTRLDYTKTTVTAICE